MPTSLHDRAMECNIIGMQIAAAHTSSSNKKCNFNTLEGKPLLIPPPMSSNKIQKYSKIIFADKSLTQMSSKLQAKAINVLRGHLTGRQLRQWL